MTWTFLLQSGCKAPALPHTSSLQGSWDFVFKASKILNYENKGTRKPHTGFLLCFTPLVHTQPPSNWSIYCKSRHSSCLRHKLFLLKLVLGIPSGKKAKQRPVCFLSGSYESSWRKMTREACKKSPCHTAPGPSCSVKSNENSHKIQF